MHEIQNQKLSVGLMISALGQKHPSPTFFWGGGEGVTVPFFHALGNICLVKEEFKTLHNNLFMHKEKSICVYHKPNEKIQCGYSLSRKIYFHRADVMHSSALENLLHFVHNFLIVCLI